MDKATARRPFSLGTWQIEPEHCRALNGERELRIEPRVMQLLSTLHTAGGPVTRDALVSEIWGHAHVTDDALNRAVAKLRRLLSREMQGTAEVQTLPRVGYQLVLANRDAPPRRQPLLWAGAGAAACAAVVAAVLLMPRSESHPVPSRMVPLTALPGHEIQPTLSPDGSHVAFSWRAERGQDWNLHVRSIDTEGQLQITDDPGDEFAPAWSPDGRQIAYLSRTEDRCEVHLVPAVGGPARRITRCNPRGDDSLDWTADGSGLVFNAPGDRSLSLVTLADGAVRRLTELPAMALSDSSPAVSPDGRTLAFARWQALGVGDVHIVDLDGGEPRRLTYDNLKIHGLTWEPDSRGLVYGSNRAGTFALWRVGTDGGAPRRVPVAARSADAPVLSRDGRRLVYEEWLGQTNLYSLDATGGQPARQITRATRWDWHPRVSPDGSRLAFISDRSGAAELWISAADGSDPLRLTGFGGPYTGSPAWAPDGNSLVFEAPAVDGNFDIYRVDAAGGSPQRLTTNPAADRYPRISADGHWLYFASRRGGGWNIWRQPLAGGAAEAVTRDGAYFGIPAADGSLYFSRLDERGIFRLGPDGSSITTVAADVEPLDCGNWDLAGGALWFIERDARRNAELVRLDLASGARSRLEVAQPLSYHSGVSASADGRVYYARVVHSETDLVMMVRE